MFELHRYGDVRAAGTANCGHPAGQYDVALVHRRQRTFKALNKTLDRLMGPPSPGRRAGRPGLTLRSPRPIKHLCSALERRGFVVETVTVRLGRLCYFGAAIPEKPDLKSRVRCR